MITNDEGLSGANVLPFQSGHGAQMNPALAKIEAYWTEVRRGRLVPSRTEIDPRGMEGVLGQAFILERLTTGLARLRIAGSHMAEILGMEARGMPLSALFDAASREALADALEAVFDEPATVRLSLASSSGFGRPEVAGNMVLLPLRSDLGDITRVLGGISLEGPLGRRPRRFEITGQSRTSLIGYAARPGETTGLQGTFTTLERRPTVIESASRKRRDHLRLVVTPSD